MSHVTTSSAATAVGPPPAASAWRRLLAVLAEPRPLPPRLVAGAFAAAGALLLLFTLGGASLSGDIRNHSDEGNFLTLAHNITHGHYALAGQQGDGLYIWHGPGLPLLMSPFVAAGVPTVIIRLIGPASLLVAAIMLRRLMLCWVSPALALASGIALALYLPLWRLLPRLTTEPLALALGLGAALAYVRARETGRLWWAVLGGLLAGWMVLVRVELGWLLPLGVLIGLAAVVARRRWHVLVVCAVALAVCAPWLVYTHDKSGQVFYWASSGGASLYWMSSGAPGERGNWVSADVVRSDPAYASHRPLFARVYRLPQVKRDLRFRHIATRQIRHHPATYARNVAYNVGRLLFGVPYSHEGLPAKRLAFAIPGLLLCAAFLLAVVLLARPDGRRIPAGAGFLLGFAAVDFLLHVPLAADPRMAALALPGVLAFVAFALQREGRREAAPAPASTAAAAPC